MGTGSLTITNLSIGDLKNISLSIPPGEIVCISGKSGSGKSRFLRAIADLEDHEGSISLGTTNQLDITGHQWRQIVRMVPAESEWWLDDVEDHFPQPPSSALLAEVQLNKEILQKPVSYLSSGERQRLALLRSLYPEPKVLLLDEPTANLDDSSRESVENWLVHLIRQQQLPVLWVAHDQAQIQRVADQHWHLEQSQLTHIGSQ
ncbi:ATP-binding cassette domain-containing protein [Hahella sp. CCB-MM4]|uniref:ABC transporter ATP-binding protein n=1 Tax=Hahella sp. (strain CCB-MM4) TaxID=1926491 RepID=UPI000B9B3F27|nr:ATP-binding cassette domain-containing protein [Hahella sp. CCB-MM4]